VAGTRSRLLAYSLRYTGAAAVAEEELAEEECLHCEINEVVREYIEWHKTVDLADLAARMAESLVELILLAPEAERDKVLAAAIAHIGHAFLEKSGAIGGGSESTH
jgi:hypothetical protein